MSEIRAKYVFSELASHNYYNRKECT